MRTWLWIPTFAGMSGVLLAGCDVMLSEPTFSVQVFGDVIETMPEENLSIEIGMTEPQVRDVLKKTGYKNEPKRLVVAGVDKPANDCGENSPFVISSYVRSGRYKGRSVEFVFKASFSDRKDDGVCTYEVINIDGVEIREPSYMKEL